MSNSKAKILPSAAAVRRCWLMKAEPESRLEKGHDVAFSVDIFANCLHKTSCWDGVRNTEAKQMMKNEMKVGDDVLFYHSNCKLPGIAGLAEVVKEGYPDHTAWDPKHPYFDPKTNEENPKWYMVDVQLHHKLPNLVPLALLQLLGSSQESYKLPYLNQSHIDTISKMQLLNRDRLSVQRVEPLAYEAIALMGNEGGWQDWPGKWNTKTKRKAAMEEAATPADEKGPTKRKATTSKEKHTTKPARETVARRTSERIRKH